MLKTLDPHPRGVLFDYGNTLIPFGQKEMDAEGGAIVSALVAAMPDVDPACVAAEFGSARLRYHKYRRETLQETDPRSVLRDTATALEHELSDEAVEEAIAAQLGVFRDVVRAGPEVPGVLQELCDRGLVLGLVSNFSHAEAIHASLDDLALTPFFKTVVVSGDLGVIKPHPELFLAGARGLALEPREILFVGDNARLDIAGAQAVGMWTALITEHLDGAYHFERPGEDHVDVTPDLMLAHLTDLLKES